ncbi:Alpha/Beta hydrolase protein [Dissophora ornata]|nr:hypothetical protein BGZ58_002454 [Dissophora ornata]KAI8605273.1 Alpha/Beta hydrolase protein [Dissophora ornata]
MYATLPNGIRVFYRESGDKSRPTILLLHGFPSSSFQYRNLITHLAPKYHIIAPDLPGFGFTEVPDSLAFKYTFANLATIIGAFLDILSITRFSVYVFDYGAPTGFRLALQRPDAVTAIITQNGNAYNAGLGDFWAPVKAYWAEPTNSEKRDVLRTAALTPEFTKAQYYMGEADPDNTVDPATYTLDWALMSRPGNLDIQLDLFLDYGTNVTLYPQFHEYFRKSQVPLLAVWGKNDIIFIAPGANAFKADLPNARIEFVDAGHFAVETHTEEIASKILSFLADNRI